MTLECHPLRLPLKTPYSWAKGTQTHRDTVLVHDMGGWGEVANPPHEAAVTPDEIARWRLDVEMAPERIRCGLMGARLDGEARDQGMPLAKLLGQRVNIQPGPVKTNALIPVLDTRETTAAARAAEEAGYTCIKVKSDGDRKKDINRLRSLRNALPEMRIRWDPNGAYHPMWAADHMHDLAQFELDYVEDPVRGRAIERIIGRSPVPIAMDEGAIDIDAISESHARIVIIKPQRVGGPDRAADMVAWCADNDRDVVVTNSLESAVGRAHALAVASLTANPAGLATDTFLGEDVATFPTRPIMEPNGDGIGIDPVITNAMQMPAPGAARADETDDASQAVSSGTRKFQRKPRA